MPEVWAFLKMMQDRVRAADADKNLSTRGAPVGALPGRDADGTLVANHIAFVSHSTRLYGASRSLFALVTGLRRRGVRLCVILPGEGPMAVALRAVGVEVVLIAFACWVGSPRQLDGRAERRREVGQAVPRIERFLRVWGAALVWSNSSVTPVGALAAARLALPHVWHLRELNCAAVGFDFDWPRHEVVALLNAASHRITVSDLARAHYEALGCAPCATVYNGIGSTRVLAARPGPGPLHDPLRLLLVGRVMADKGQTVAIRALRWLGDRGHGAWLRIVGDGELQQCRELADRLGVADRVELTGFCAEVDRHYAWSDMVLNCSAIESMGRVTVEAMSHGRPVVADFRGGNGELIEHRVTGLLYDGSPEDLAARVVELIESESLRRRIEAKARRWVMEQFTRERYVDRLLGVIESTASASCLAETGTSGRLRARTR